MSASTERKNRQTARSSGTYAKDIAADKEAAKLKKARTRWIIVGIVIVIFVALAIYLNTGSLYRSLTGLTVTNEEVTAGDITLPAGERTFSVAEVNYVYNTQYVNFMNTYGSYLSSIISSTEPLDEQQCPDEMKPDGKEDYTWDDYFKDTAEAQLEQLAAFEAYAKVEGITLNDDDQKQIDDAIASISDAAKQNNYASASKFLRANYGRGVNESVARDIMELQAIAGKVQDSITDAQSYTAEQLAEKYDAVKDSYDKFTYSFYLVAAATDDSASADSSSTDGSTTDAAAPTDEALAAAHTTAEQILAAVNGGSSLADAAKAAVADAEITEQKDLAGSSVEADLSEWIKSADRKEGDTAVIDGSTGSYVVVFTKRDNNQAPTEESGDMNYCDYVAKQLLDQEALNQWNTDVFSKLVAAYSGSFGSTRYIGR